MILSYVSAREVEERKISQIRLRTPGDITMPVWAGH